MQQTVVRLLGMCVTVVVLSACFPVPDFAGDPSRVYSDNLIDNALRFRHGDTLPKDAIRQKFLGTFSVGSSLNSAVNYLSEIGSRCAQDKENVVTIFHCHYEKQRKLIAYKKWGPFNLLRGEEYEYSYVDNVLVAILSSKDLIEDVQVVHSAEMDDNARFLILTPEGGR